MSHITGRLRPGGLVSILAALSAAAPLAAGASGAVYTSTDSAAGNMVVMFNRAADGTLTPGGSFATAGKGTGVGLGSQGAVALTSDGGWLLVVNGGSNDITVFSVAEHGLIRRSRTSSHGTMPISLTEFDGIVYVLNAGGTPNIVGFHLDDDGKLTEIPDSKRVLTGVAPAEVSFNRDADLLAVTYKTSNTIDVFTLENSLARLASTIPSHGAEPFGFAFTTHNRLIVTEAVPGAVSSYSVSEDGDVRLISGTVLTTQTAACWIAVTRNGKFAYAANAGSDSISSFTVGRDGTLTLLAAVAAQDDPGAKALDLAFSNGDRFLFSLGDNTGTIHWFRVMENGALEPVGSVSGLTAFASGLAAR
jgi:6-phosphogluconolactonase